MVRSECFCDVLVYIGRKWKVRIKIVNQALLWFWMVKKYHMVVLNQIFTNENEYNSEPERKLLLHQVNRQINLHDNINMH